MKIIAIRHFGDKTTGATYREQVKVKPGDILECNDDLANERIKNGFAKEYIEEIKPELPIEHTGEEETFTEEVVEEDTTEEVVEEDATEEVVEEDATEEVTEEDTTEEVTEEDTTEEVVEEDATEEVVEEDATEEVVEDKKSRRRK